MNEQDAKPKWFFRVDFYLITGLFILALIPRLLYVVQIETPPFSDEKDYEKCALNFITGHGLIMNDMYKAYRAPAYPLFIAAIYKISPGNVLLVRIIQAVLGALLPVILYVIIRLIPYKSVSGWKIYLWPMFVGIQAVFMDSFIFFTGQMLTETIFCLQLSAFILLCGLVLGWFYFKNSSLYIWILMGVMAGITTLTRPVFLLIFLGMLFFICFKIGIKNLKSTVLIAFVFCILTILPWTFRNRIVLGHWVPVTTNTGVNFYIGHNPYYSYWSTGDKTGIRNRTDFNEIEESNYFFKLGLDYIKSNPGQFLKNIPVKLYNLYLAPWPKERPFKPWPWFGNERELRFAGGIKWPTLSWGIVYLLPGIAGIIFAVYKKEKWAVFLLILIIIYSGSYVLFFTRARFLVPIIMVYQIFVGYLICSMQLYFFNRREQRGRAANSK